MSLMKGFSSSKLKLTPTSSSENKNNSNNSSNNDSDDSSNSSSNEQWLQDIGSLSIEERRKKRRQVFVDLAIQSGLLPPSEAELDEMDRKAEERDRQLLVDYDKEKQKEKESSNSNNNYGNNNADVKSTQNSHDGHKDKLENGKQNGNHDDEDDDDAEEEGEEEGEEEEGEEEKEKEKKILYANSHFFFFFLFLYLRTNKQTGVVEEVGEGVTNVSKGTRVVIINSFGCWTDQIVVDSDQAFPIPDNMTFEQAAAIPVTYLTAYIMLFNMGNLRPNQTVLVHMAAGGVGIAATQLSKTVQNVRIIGTASASKHDAIRKNGVTDAIDYRTTDYVAAVKAATGDKGVDLILDPLGGPDFMKNYNLLAPLGRHISFGGANFLSGQSRNLFKVASEWWQWKSVHPTQLMKVCLFYF